MTEDTEKSERIAALVERLIEQPQLLEKVNSLLNGPPDTASSPSVTDNDISASAEVSAEQSNIRDNGTKDRRHQLLCALRPYLSDRRAKALDSFEAIANLLDFMKQT